MVDLNLICSSVAKLYVRNHRIDPQPLFEVSLIISIYYFLLMHIEGVSVIPNILAPFFCFKLIYTISTILK